MHKKQPTIIALVGMPGAGKSSCVAFLEEKGWPSVYLGGITVDEVRARGLEISETNERIVREDLRKQFGIGVMAERILPKIDALAVKGHDVIIADGLYSWTEYKIFKEHYGDKAIIIAITAPRQLRHERLARREIRPLSADQVTAREYAEIENIEKGGPIANADFTIANAGDIASMTADLAKIINVAIG